MKRTILLSFLIITFTAGAQDFYSSGDCKASFEFAVNPNIYTFAPATAIDFFDKSEGEVIAWYWDCGDSLTSTEQNPMFIFNHPLGGPNVKISPYRKISLTIVTDSCKSTIVQVINIMDGTLYESQTCVALFKYYEMERDSASGTAKIHFDNYSEGDSLSYFWQFGNGHESTEKDPVITFKTDQPEYKVCLTVIGADSCSSIFCDAVYLQYPVIDTVQPDCKVDFGFDRKDVLMTPLPSVLFDFYYKSYPEATEWYWDFDDGTTSNEPNPTHVYVMPYMSDSMKVMYNPFRTVCLTIKTEDDCKITNCQTIQVFDYNQEPEPEKCPVYFKYYQPTDIVSIPEVVPIQLVDVSEGEVVSRLWQFEDGTTSNEKEPLVSFNIFQPVHKVCLTVTFADSCTNTFCDAIYVNGGYIDTVDVNPGCPYYIKIDGGFPIQMSSCAGWASANVYLENELVEPDFISWSTGDTLSKVERLCPTQTYTVKALMPDGWVVYSNFIFNSDGSITPINQIPPVMLVNWWLSGEREKMYVCPDVGAGMKVEWRLCDGTIVEADSIPLDAINCGGSLSNMIVKDSLGNIVYTENIALKGTVTGIEDLKVEPTVKLWPNPVSSKLNIRYSGEYQSEINIAIFDILGKQISVESYSNISDGYEFSVDTGSLKQGIYICRISTSGKTIHSEKFSRR